MKHFSAVICLLVVILTVCTTTAFCAETPKPPAAIEQPQQPPAQQQPPLPREAAEIMRIIGDPARLREAALGKDVMDFLALARLYKIRQQFKLNEEQVMKIMEIEQAYIAHALELQKKKRDMNTQMVKFNRGETKNVEMANEQLDSMIEVDKQIQTLQLERLRKTLDVLNPEQRVAFYQFNQRFTRDVQDLLQRFNGRVGAAAPTGGAQPPQPQPPAAQKQKQLEQKKAPETGGQPAPSQDMPAQKNAGQ